MLYNLIEKYQRPNIMNREHLRSIACWLIKAVSKNGDWVLEIGAHEGLTTAFMGKILAGFPTEEHSILSIDPFNRANPNDSGIGDLEKYLENIAGIEGIVFSHIAETSIEAAARVPGGFSFIVIDGSHTILNVRADIANYLPKLAPGGIAWFHDYCMDGVKFAVNDFIESNPKWEIIEQQHNLIVLRKPE